MEFELTKEYAEKLDTQDSLKSYRSKFIIPKTKDGKDSIYLCGNSLGLQPINAREFINKEFDMWATFGVEGHFKGTNWKDYHEKLSELCAPLVGAKQSEVVLMNTLTVNLHLMMVSFYQPTKDRYKILVEHSPFPSDQYAIKSQIKFHGFDPKEALIELKPRKNEKLLRTEDILKKIEENGDEIALILIGGVNYLSGQVFEMEEISKKGHEFGCMVGFDLAHAFGNVNLKLHDWDVDFAVWCTYKYGNSGPGAIAGCFVHEKHGSKQELNRFAGWWGHDKEIRFLMEPDFVPIKGAEGWQISNPPIFSMTPILASLEIFKEVGMEQLIKKSKLLTSYLQFLINSLNSNKIFLTPEKESMRGCQLSVHVVEDGQVLFDKLINSGVICDWREPDVIRIAPVPLYNSFSDIYQFVQILKKFLEEI